MATTDNEEVPRSVDEGVAVIDRVTSAMNLSKEVRDAAVDVFKEASRLRFTRGRTIEGVAATAVYAACRKCGTPVTLGEVAERSGVDRREVARTYKSLSDKLNLHTVPEKPQSFIPRFCALLRLSEDVETKAIEIATTAEKTGFTCGRGHTGTAAAAIYLASVICDERRTQREIARVADVTEATIRNICRDLTGKLELQIQLQ